MKPTEERFEEHIEEFLQSTGYTSTDFHRYDRNLCMIKEEVLHFLESTQPEKLERLKEIYDSQTESKILTRISSEIKRRGIIDVLRGGVVDRGVYLDLTYFEPKSGHNPDHQQLFSSNRFTIVRQLHYSVQNENSIDMGLFLNGLPIVTMELKNQLTGQNIKHSENQYRNDRDPREPLLQFKRCLVHFCVDNDKVSMTTRLSGSKTFFLPFNKGVENPPVENGYRSKYLWKDILTPNSLLDIIENFVHVSKDKKFFFNDKTQKIDSKESEVLIFPRFHQLDLIRSFRRSIRKDGVGKNYLVQHTTGSGKSYSIGWLSHTLSSLYRTKDDTKRMFDTIIVVTDRTVLDDQLRNTIQSLEKIDGVVSGVKKGSKELREFLEKGKDIVITTIQKFPFISETISSLGDRTFGVIIDEVHSSQSGELSKELKKSLSKKDEEEEDFEEVIRREIENRGKQDHISFFGFTGTPKEKTLELFGTKKADGTFVPFHIYSMYQSINEGFTLDVLQNYTTYKRYFKVKEKNGDKDIEIPSNKGKRELIRYVDSHEITIRNKVGVIIDHWINKGSKEIKGTSRGMVVTQSRKHCVRYFQEINRQLEERGIKYRTLVGFSGEVNLDGEKFTENSLNNTVDHEGNIPLGLKNPKYRLLVVSNKFQTGFDEPLVQSMYVDKSLGGVQCVQTLSRLNRRTSGKTQTFVLDFVNEPDDVISSFQRFYQSTVLEGETDPNRLYDTLREVEDNNLYTKDDVDRFCKIFYDPNRDEGSLQPILEGVVDKFKSVEEDEIREEIRSKIQSFLRMYGYLSQIINFTDIELEKSFIFLKYVNKKLPKRDSGRLDLSDSIDLDSLRVQKIHENNYQLEQEDSILEPPGFESTGIDQPEFEFLSEIINRVNTTYGQSLNEDDKVVIRRLREKLKDDQEVNLFMNGDNSEDNKKKFYMDRLDEKLLDFINDRFDFYKRMNDNPSVKNTIFDLLYTDYRNQR